MGEESDYLWDAHMIEKGREDALKWHRGLRHSFYCRSCKHRFGSAEALSQHKRDKHKARASSGAHGQGETGGGV